jgi:hypothetical protein
MLHGGASRVTTLSLHLEDGQDAGISEIIQALPSNLNLMKLNVKGKISKASEDEFIRMMETNHKLQSLNLDDSDILVQRAIRFYATLNNAGRGLLIGNENATRDLWIQALYHVNQDIDGLFYFLIRNP